MSPHYSGTRQLRLGFFLAALLVPILHSNVPAYDTSHLLHFDSNLHPAEQNLGIENSVDVSNTGASAANMKSHEIVTLSNNLIPLPGLRWDALHYHGIASYGTYIFEEQYAFSPGIPVVLRLVHIAKYYVLLGLRRLFATSVLTARFQHELEVWVMKIGRAAILGFVATQPCLEVYSLTYTVFHSREFARMALIVQAIMGAPPVALRSAYAEPLFACFSFRGMRAFHGRHYLISSLYFALATCFRANGTFSTGFILYGLLAQPLAGQVASTLSSVANPRLFHIGESLLIAMRRITISTIIYTLLLSILVLAPFASQQYLAYNTFCWGPSTNSASTTYPRPWCTARPPLIYSFVQSEYWQVGLWRYWALERAHRIAVAVPMLALVGLPSIMLICVAVCFGLRISHITKPSTAIDSPQVSYTAPVWGVSSPAVALSLPLFPYALHALVLSLVLLTVAHVEIALRVLPVSTPCAAWAGAMLIIKGAQAQQRNAEGDRMIFAETIGEHEYSAQKAARSWVDWYMEVKGKTEIRWRFWSHLWLTWSIVWMLVSSVLWLSFLPPA